MEVLMPKSVTFPLYYADPRETYRPVKIQTGSIARTRGIPTQIIPVTFGENPSLIRTSPLRYKENRYYPL